jgi:hypothetical protein
MRTLYSIEDIDFGESDKFHFFTNRQLFTFGDNLEELLDNAVYILIDQDGGEAGEERADDQGAIDYVTDWYRQHNCPEMEFPYSNEKDPMTLAKNAIEDELCEEFSKKS